VRVFNALAQMQPGAVVSSMSVQWVAVQALAAAYIPSASAEVTLQVRNIVGRLLSTVPQGTGEAGVNTATWNLRNTVGVPVPSGMYLCAVVVYGEDGIRFSAVRTLRVQR
jgi:flagellar hook assembly protein FlgD